MNDTWLLDQGDTGQRVRDMQWLFSGHNRYSIITYTGKIDGDFGPATGRAAKDMKFKIGYPDEACVPTAGSTLRAYLIDKEADGAQLRPTAYIIRAKQRATDLTSYPLGRDAKIIGWPYQGTHTRGNWESDRAMDLAVPEGTAVLACFPGTIGPQFGPLNASDPRLAGLRCHIVGEDDESYYAHLSKFALGIKPGVRVNVGQTIGYSGSANGVAHLHWALRDGWPPTFIARESV